MQFLGIIWIIGIIITIIIPGMIKLYKRLNMLKIDKVYIMNYLLSIYLWAANNKYIMKIINLYNSVMFRFNNKGGYIMQSTRMGKQSILLLDSNGKQTTIILPKRNTGGNNWIKVLAIMKSAIKSNNDGDIIDRILEENTVRETPIVDGQNGNNSNVEIAEISENDRHISIIKSAEKIDITSDIIKIAGDNKNFYNIPITVSDVSDDYEYIIFVYSKSSVRTKMQPLKWFHVNEPIILF